MDVLKIDAALAEMTSHEVDDAMWFVGVIERAGSMSKDEADEWRRRIMARRAFLELSTGDSLPA